MNPLMYEHPATQANIALLRERGATVLEPAYGRMAEHAIGKGRMPEVPVLEGELRALLGRATGTLRGRRVVISAGGTHEPIDPVRYIGNRSTGLMGYALAAAARDRGAAVTLISGPTALTPPAAVTVVHTETALAMRDAVYAAIEDADLLIMAAAVADFRPATFAERKIKKGTDETLTLELVRNPDILAGIAQRRTLIKVGFAAETHDLLTYAHDKLARKGLDLIVANEAVASIGSPTSQVTLIDATSVTQLPEQPKEHTAVAILDAVVARFPQLQAAADHP